MSAVGEAHRAVSRIAKADDGQGKLLRGLGDHLPQPRDFDDWHWLTQLNQARAVAFGIRHFRSHAPYCMGTVVWQLNDCWPVVSWSAVDVDGRRKPLWYALREAYADRILVVRDGAVYAVNDGPQIWAGPAEPDAAVTVTAPGSDSVPLRVARRSLSGATLGEAEMSVDCAPRSVARIELPVELTGPDDKTRELLVAELGGQRVVEFYAEDTEVAFPCADLTAHVDPLGPGEADGYRVTVDAHTLVRDLALFPDRLDPAAVADRALVTLLPGEQGAFEVTGARLDDPSALKSRPVLRCVNEATAPN
ncbi:hypothetical protein CG723_23220 [Streptomyces sp. CB01635]|uniref:hypothetical protein n=1 Tax=unclassified Streptomyces TaxID=2593676 RepID=UPI000C2734EA|nr:hypothetical protein [Streptomyces sp. CB01635]PJN09267.1 hypothetical protein CG723_23220 [Streptomyces sp. CB01635]